MGPGKIALSAMLLAWEGRPIPPCTAVPEYVFYGATLLSHTVGSCSSGMGVGKAACVRIGKMVVTLCRALDDLGDGACLHMHACARDRCGCLCL